MAGDALRDANFEARSKLSEDPEKAAERAAKVGTGYDVSGYTDKEISMALQGDSFGDDDYARLTGGQPDAPSTNPVDNVVEDTAEPTDQAKPEVNVDFGDGGIDLGVKPPAEQPVFGTPGTLPGLAGGQFVMQDNDQQSSVVGDNNTVTQNQDNSIGGYGGRANDFKKSWMDYKFQA